MKKETRKRRPWLWLLPVLGLAALALGLMLFRNPNSRTAPALVEEESWFSGFVVQDNTVYFLCTLTVRNPTEEAIAVEISGDFSEDFEGGLLLGRELYAFRLDDKVNSDFLSLDAETQKQTTDDDKRRFFLLRPGGNCFWVVFPGAHGKTDVKQNRLLPPIRFLPLEDVTPKAVSEAMDCRIYKDPESCRTFLLDGKKTEVLCYPGGYGFTNGVAWDYDGNGVQDLLFTGSEGSGIHRSYLALFDRTSRESQELYLYTPRDFSPREAYGSDLLVEQETDGNGVSSFAVYTADVEELGDSFADLRFTKREKAGVVEAVRSWDGESVWPLFWPASEAFFPQADDNADAEEPTVCEVSLGDDSYSVTGETAAELYRICADAQKRAEPGRFFFLGGERPILSLNFLWSSGLRFDYEIDGDDKSFSGLDVQSYREPLQLPAGTYDKLLEALEDVGEPTKEPEAAPRSCTVEYGGGRRTVEGETAAELYRICAEAQLRGEIIPPAEEEPKSLGVSLYFLNEGNPTEGTFCDIFSDDKGWFADGLVYAPPCYAFPAGTYDALLDVLGQKGELPAPAGEQIAGNQVYGLFEEDGVYALQLYSPEGDLVWAFGPGRHEPRVEEAEPGLWSVSLGAGPSLSLHWTVYYRPETGQLSDAIYGILARDGERVLCISGRSLLLRGIFERGDRTMLDSFSESLAPAAEPFESAAFTEDGRAVTVTYLAGEDYHKVTETIPLPQEAGDP